MATHKRPMFQPEKGKVYNTLNGDKFLCVGLPEEEYSAELIGVSSGWFLEVYGCHLDKDHNLSWDSSSGKGLRFEAYVPAHTAYSMKQMREFGYHWHICGVKSLGETTERNIYCRDEKFFCENIYDIFQEFWDPTILLAKLGK